MRSKCLKTENNYLLIDCNAIRKFCDFLLNVFYQEKLWPNQIRKEKEENDDTSSNYTSIKFDPPNELYQS